MKSTGIVRKVDELGRVVIPKEIRKVAFISEGTPLEIYRGDDGEIILKKYSLLKNLKNFSEEVVESLNSVIKGKVAIFDKNEVISCSGINLKNATTFYFENSFDKIHNKNGLVKVGENTIYFEEIKCENQVIGGIMVWNIPVFSSEIKLACSVMSNYLSRLIN